MNLITPILGASFCVVNLHTTPVLPVFENIATLRQFMAKTNGEYTEVVELVDLCGLIVAAKEKQIEVVIVKEVTDEKVKMDMISTHWWEGTCQCWVCDVIINVLVPGGQKPTSGLKCLACESQTMYPIEGEENDHDKSSD